MWQWLKKENGAVYKHQPRFPDTARQFVCRPAEAHQPRDLLHQALPETSQSPVVCVHLATGNMRARKWLKRIVIHVTKLLKYICLC